MDDSINLQNALTPTEWKEILDGLIDTAEVIEVRLDPDNELPHDFLAKMTKRLLIRQKLVSAIASYLIDCKEFQPGYHDGEASPPEESSWEEVQLFNNKKVEWEIDL